MNKKIRKLCGISALGVLLGHGKDLRLPPVQPAAQVLEHTREQEGFSRAPPILAMPSTALDGVSSLLFQDESRWHASVSQEAWQPRPTETEVRMACCCRNV